MRMALSAPTSLIFTRPDAESEAKFQLSAIGPFFETPRKKWEEVWRSPRLAANFHQSK